MPNVSRRLRNTAKRALWKLFEQGQRLGFDILPRHFYSEIPDLRYLRTATDWKEPYSMAGVAGTGLDSQLAFVNSCCSPPIVAQLRSKRVWELACSGNGAEGYGPVEADFLFAFVATRKPKQIFQIGCGVSTAVCLLAAEHAAYSPTITCVEPYPTDFLLRESSKGRIALIKQMTQSLDPAIIDGLGPDTLFFVDSTHTLGPGGEVSRIILEMLPRLKQGACAHFHDIYFPYDYTRDVLNTLVFPHESVLLHAFLAFNSRFRILAALSTLHYTAPQRLAEYLPNYRPAQNDAGMVKSEGHFPSSTYLEVVG